MIHFKEIITMKDTKTLLIIQSVCYYIFESIFILYYFIYFFYYNVLKYRMDCATYYQYNVD